MKESYPPATKCAHDFATGAGLDAIETAYFGGVDGGVLGSDPRSRNDPSSGPLRASEGGCIEVFMEKCVLSCKNSWYKNWRSRVYDENFGLQKRTEGDLKEKNEKKERSSEFGGD